MLSLPPGIQVFMAVAPVDMRKSFDGLTAAVRAVFERDVLDGHLFPGQKGPPTF
jgi:transposase